MAVAVLLEITYSLLSSILIHFVIIISGTSGTIHPDSGSVVAASLIHTLPLSLFEKDDGSARVSCGLCVLTDLGNCGACFRVSK